MRPGTCRQMIRETGFAMTALAVWFLLLLTPLHQSAGVLRAFAEAGHNIGAVAQICVTLSEDSGSDQVTPQCPVQALAQTLTDGASGTFTLLAPGGAASSLLMPDFAWRASPGPEARWPSPRAPPSIA